MDATVYAQRKSAHLQPIFDAAAQLDALEKSGDLVNDERKVVRNAAVQLRSAATKIATLGDRLLPYSDPDFYRDLPPSRATEDQGKHAANGLEMVFSE